MQRPLHPIHNLFLPTKVEPLLFSKNWQLYFSLVYSSGPLYSKTYSLHNPKHVIPSTCTRQKYSSSLLHQSLFAMATTSPTLPVSSHSQKSPKVEPLLFSKNWQLYFSLVYLFWASLQRNLLTSKPKTRHPKHMHQTRIFQQPFTPKPFCSGHYIPYIACFFPQPEKPKSRVPSFLEKLATLIFTGLPLLGLSAAKLIHFITQNTSSQAPAPDKNIPAAFYTTAFLQRPLHPIHDPFLPTARNAQK